MQDHSERELTPEDIKRILQEAVLRDYPNPERRGCPEAEAIAAAAEERLPNEHFQWSHISRCSPCYEEFLKSRARVVSHRRKRSQVHTALAWAIPVVVLAVGWPFLTQRHQQAPSPIVNGAQHPIVDTEKEAGVLMAVLNMQSAPAPGTRSPPNSLQHLPRARMSPLMIYLPIGSEVGKYDVALIKPDMSGTPLLTLRGTAQIQGGLTILRVSTDFSTFQMGTYALSVSRERTTLWICRFVLS